MIEIKTIKQRRPKRVVRMRIKILGTKDRPRLSFFRSNTTVYAQVVDTSIGKTLTTIKITGKNTAAVKLLAEKTLKKLQELHVATVVFDRSGNKYHGVVKTFVEAIREGGIIV